MPGEGGGRARATSWELEVRTPDGSARTEPLEGGRLVLGRAPEAQLRFPEDTSLSRLHLALEPEDGGWSVEDLGSKNGTWLNGKPLRRRERLAPGDRLEAGRVALLLRGPHRAGAAEAGVFFSTQPISQMAGQTTKVALRDVVSKLGGTGSDRSAKPGSWDSASLRPEAAEILVQAGRELVRHRPLDELFDLILDLAIRAAGAERGVLLTREDGEVEVRARRGEGFRISSAVRDQVLEERKSILVRDIDLDEKFRGRQSLVLHNVRGMMAVPLQTDDRCLGLVYVDSHLSAKEFTELDLNLLTVLANVAAIRLEHERLAEVERVERELQWDLDQAAEIQQALLPLEAPAIEGWEIVAHNQPCKTVGGDYYDAFPCPDGRLALVLADVSGKGTAAALMMCGLQARVRMIGQQFDDPTEVLERLNRSIVESSPGNRFVSLVLCFVRLEDGTIECGNAGHNPPLLLRAAGGHEEIPAGGPVLGILEEADFASQSFVMAPGDLLAAYSDGVTESADARDREYGEERLLEFLRTRQGGTVASVPGDLMAALDRWRGGQPPADDTTVLLLRREPG